MNCHIAGCGHSSLHFKVHNPKHQLIYFEWKLCFWCAVTEADTKTNSMSRFGDVTIRDPETRKLFTYNPLSYDGKMPSWADA